MRQLNWGALGTIVTVIGLIFTFWIWNNDQNSHSLKMEIISVTALQPTDLGNVSALNLKIMIDDQEIKTPYLTVLKITNNGSKPIMITDFESPIEFKVSEEVKIRKFRINETTPRDLNPNISLHNNVCYINPLLLNSNDSITISLLTSEQVPVFQKPRIRIANIPSIEFAHDNGKNKIIFGSMYRGLAGAFLAIFYALSFLIAMDVLFRNRSLSIHSGGWLLLAFSISAMLGSVRLTNELISLLNLGYFNNTIIMVPFLLIGILIFYKKIKNNEEKSTKNSS